MPPFFPPPPNPPGTSTKSSVAILYNGSGLHSIVGPTPFMSIDRTINRDNAGVPTSMITSINLDGKIVKTTGSQSGISAVYKAINDLKDLFTKCEQGVLKVQCNGTDLAEFSGVRVSNFKADKSSDNWVFTADYSIGLEIVESAISGEPPVSNTSDSWSIEPIEDYIYMTWDSGVQKKPEGSENTRIGSLGGSNFKFTNMPQYRVSHRVSAAGLQSSGNSSSSTPGNNNTSCPAGKAGEMSKAYLNAKKWVEQRLAWPFQGSGAYIAGGGAGGGSTTLPFGSSISLFNHVRSINFSLTEGSYEVNDNWLAFNSGVRYIEDFSIESSTSDNYTTTVRVQGTVRGLETETTGILRTGLAPDNSGLIGLDFAKETANGPLTSSGGSTSSPSSATPPATTGNIKAFKYQNALDGWLDDIKPTLYTRACSIVNSRERTQTYVNPAASNPPVPPINPIFAKQTLLNVIPVSTTEGHSLLNGTISYSYEFNNKQNAISGTLSQNISITDDGPADVIAETFVVGRQLGPIIQKMGKSSARKSVSVEVVVVPPSSISEFLQVNSSCPLYTGGYIYQTIDTIISGLQPFGAQVTPIWPQSRGTIPGNVFLNSDNRTWNPTEGRYSRSVSWTYQTCQATDNWMNH